MEHRWETSDRKACSRRPLDDQKRKDDRQKDVFWRMKLFPCPVGAYGEVEDWEGEGEKGVTI